MSKQFEILFEIIFLLVLTFFIFGVIIVKLRSYRYAGMAELADARDLKSREIFSRTGSTPASGTIDIAEWSSLVARRAHNPEVMRFKSHLRNHVGRPKKIAFRKPEIFSGFLRFSPLFLAFLKIEHSAK